MSAPVWIGVAALGAIGALARLLLEDLVSSKLPVPWPVGTFAVNISGTFVLGMIAGLALTGNAMILGRIGHDRLIHDILDLDARDPQPRRRRPPPRRDRQHSDRPRHRPLLPPRSGAALARCCEPKIVSTLVRM